MRKVMVEELKEKQEFTYKGNSFFVPTQIVCKCAPILESHNNCLIVVNTTLKTICPMGKDTFVWIK